MQDYKYGNTRLVCSKCSHEYYGDKTSICCEQCSYDSWSREIMAKAIKKRTPIIQPQSPIPNKEEYDDLAELERLFKKAETGDFW